MVADWLEQFGQDIRHYSIG